MQLELSSLSKFLKGDVPNPSFDALGVLHLICLNKYLSRFIIPPTSLAKLTNSCLTYNLIVSLFLYLGLLCNLIEGFIEKINILLSRYNWDSIFGKFVVSSIIRCLKISTARGDCGRVRFKKVGFCGQLLFHMKNVVSL